MGERSGAVRQQTLVADVGQWYDAGTIVRIERAAEPGQLRLIPDSRGDREVLACRRVPMMDRPMLVVTLHRI